MSDLYSDIISTCCPDGDGEDWVAVDFGRLRALVVKHDAELLKSLSLELQSDGSLLHYNGKKWTILRSSQKQRG